MSGTESIELPGATSGQFVVQIVSVLSDLPWTGSKAPASVTMLQLTLDNRPLAINVNISDILRPAAITLDEFGASWPTVGGEAAQPGILAGQGTWPDVVSMRLLQRANVKVVQVIGVELVAAAYINTAKKSPVMVHVRSQADKGIVDVTVRSSNKGVSESLAKYLGAALK